MFHWLERKVAFTSPLVQNEILQLFANSVVKSSRVADAKQLAVIVDSTQDISRKEQLSICLRYIDSEYMPHEDFVGLCEPNDTS